MDQTQGWNDCLQHGDSTVCFSYVTRRGSKYHVRNSEGKKVTVVHSINDTWPAIKSYYLKNPRWFLDGSSQFKFTPFGLLQVQRKLHVQQDRSGKWVAYCNLDCLLGSDGEPAIFTSLEEAQCAAEKHLFDELARCLTGEDDHSTCVKTMQ